MWNVATGELIRDFAVHTDTIYSMSFSYDGAYLATTSKDKIVRVLDARTGAIVSQGPGHDGSKASRVVFLGTSNKLLTTGVSRSSERQIAIWDPVCLCFRF
jgi:WD40 repeat protein